MRCSLAISLFVCAWVGSAWGQEKAPAAGPVRIVRVRFEGNRQYDDAFLEQQVATKAGQPRDAGLLERDRRLLRRFFAEVTDIEEREVEGGIEIVFHVLDDQVTGKVELAGLAQVSEKELRPRLLTRRGRPLSLHRLRHDRELIAREHRERGYHFAEVEFRRTRGSKPQVENVVFQVYPGRRVRIKEVLLEGAHSLSRRKLLRVAQNSDLYRTHRWPFRPIRNALGKLLFPSYYHRGRIDEDRRRMEELYRDEGWLDARVAFVGVSFDALREFATVRYRVDEGQRYTVGAVTVRYRTEGADGQPLEEDREQLTPESLAGLSALLKGQPYRASDLRETVRDIEERLSSRFYSVAEVRPEPAADSARHVVTLRIDVTAGPKVKLGRIRIRGNRFTRDSVLRRQFRAGAIPGGFVDLAQVRAGYNRIRRLQYFDSVRLGGVRGNGLVANPERPGEYDILLDVREETTPRTLTAGAGISTDGGAQARLQIAWNNFDIRKPPPSLWDVLEDGVFRGGGQSLRFNAVIGTVDSSFGVGFSDPAVRDSPWGLNVGVSRRVGNRDDYEESIDGINIGVARFLDAQSVWQLAFDWSLRQVTIDEPEFNAPFNALDVQGGNLVHEVGLSLRRDRRDDQYFFLAGHYSQLSASLLGGVLGGDADAIKLGLSHRFGVPVHQPQRGGWHRFKIVARADWANAIDGAADVPIFERYFMGGRSTLRGFDWREVGPRSNGRPTGGEFRVAVTAQYTIPLSNREEGDVGIDLIFFLDQGGLTRRVHDWNSAAWRISAGFGIGIAFGGINQPPLILEFGWPLREQAGDESQVVSLSFERNF